MRTLLASLIVCCCTFASFASVEDASIDDLGWISGAWQGELFGANAAERWSAPQGRHMIGVFHMWSDKGPSVYELLEIMEETDAETGEHRISLRFKHFNTGTLEPWEKDEPLEFRLTELDGQRALFTAASDEQRSVTSMEYRRAGDTLKVHVIGAHESGESFEFTAEFARQND